MRTKLDIHYVGSFLSREDGCDPINLLNPPHLCVCPRPGPVFPTSYVLVFIYSAR
jgi:hypothetical protein